MDNAALDTILVVSEREFSVNRKILIENSSYFKAMFEGGFRESSADRVELKGIRDADAFAVLLDYILNKRVNLKEVEDIMPNVLALCDMLSLDEFLKFFKQDFLKKFSDLQTAESILVFTEKLNLKPSLWSELLSFLRNAFKIRSSRGSEEPDVSVLDESPDLIADILGTEEKNTLCFWDVEYDERFRKGLISWVLDHQLPQSNIRKVVRCFGMLRERPRDLLEMIDVEEKSRERYVLKPEVRKFISDTQDCLRRLAYRLCVGSFGPNDITIFQLNFGDMEWELNLKFNKLFIQRSCCVGETTTNDKELDTYYWYLQPGPSGYCFFDNTGVTDTNRGSCANLHSGSSSMYTSAQHASFGTYHLLIFELENGATVFSDIFRTEVPGPILGCELLRLEDVLHGFLTYELGNNRYNICHFALHRHSEDETWSISDFRLEPILSDIGMKYIPQASAASTEGNIVLFLRCRLNLFLTEYNIENGFLKPLGIVGMPFFQLQMTGEEEEYDEKYDDKHKKVCTITVACCSGKRSPIYNLFPASGKERIYFTSCFLNNFDDCAKNENHLPRIKSIIHICEPSDVTREGLGEAKTLPTGRENIPSLDLITAPF